MEWINVNSKLPKNYETIIICYYPKYLKNEGIIIPAKFEDGLFFDTKNNFFTNVEQSEIRFWQRLPKAPN